MLGIHFPKEALYWLLRLCLALIQVSQSVLCAGPSTQCVSPASSETSWLQPMLCTTGTATAIHTGPPRNVPILVAGQHYRTTEASNGSLAEKSTIGLLFMLGGATAMLIKTKVLQSGGDTITGTEGGTKAQEYLTSMVVYTTAQIISFNIILQRSTEEKILHESYSAILHKHKLITPIVQYSCLAANLKAAMQKIGGGRKKGQKSQEERKKDT
ncbi:hypothetical protein PAMP_012255 [Pampus punctatissimus]